MLIISDTQMPPCLQAQTGTEYQTILKNLTWRGFSLISEQKGVLVRNSALYAVIQKIKTLLFTCFTNDTTKTPLVQESVKKFVSIGLQKLWLSHIDEDVKKLEHCFGVSVNEAEILRNWAVKYSKEEVDGVSVFEARIYALRCYEGAVKNGYKLTLEDSEIIKANANKVCNSKWQYARWCQLAVNNNDPEAMFNLGDQYTNVGYVEEGLTWMRKAANLGHVNTMVELADYQMSNRHDIPALPDVEGPVKWYIKAACSGDVDAMRRLVEIYESDELNHSLVPQIRKTFADFWTCKIEEHTFTMP